jgi:hypothetical protein
MNEDLANYLLWLVSDPERLADFNNAALRNDMIESSGLPDDDKSALRGNDVTTLVSQLRAGPGDLKWVLIPVESGGFAFAIGVMTPTPPPPPLRISSAARRMPATKGAKARKSAKRKTAKSRRRPKGKGRG